MKLKDRRPFPALALAAVASLLAACDGDSGSGPDDDLPDLNGTFTGTVQFDPAVCSPVKLTLDTTPLPVSFEITQRGSRLDVIDTANGDTPFTGTVDENGEVLLTAVLTFPGSVGSVAVRVTETVRLDLQVENFEGRLRGVASDEQLVVEQATGQTFTNCVSSGTAELNRLDT